MLKWKIQRKEIRYRLKLSIDQFYMTFQTSFIHTFQIMGYLQNLYFPNFVDENLVAPNTNHF